MDRPTALLVAGLTCSSAAFGGWSEATEAFRQNRFEDAAQELRAVLERHPEHAPSHYMLGRALLQLGRSDDAVGSLERAVELEPANAAWRLLLAKALDTSGPSSRVLEALAPLRLDAVPEEIAAAYAQALAAAARRAAPERALEVLEQAVEDRPGDPRLWATLAGGRKRLGRSDAAFEAYAAAAAAAPDDPTYVVQAVTFAYGLAGAAEGAAAAGWYRRGADLAEGAAGDGSAELLRLAGAGLMGAGECAAAVPWLRRSLAVEPELALARYDLGQCALELGDARTAASELETALRKTTDAALRTEILSTLGLAFHHLAEYRLARDAYLEAGDEEKAREMTEAIAAQEINEKWERQRLHCLDRRGELLEVHRDVIELADAEATASWRAEWVLFQRDCLSYLEEAELALPAEPG